MFLLVLLPRKNCQNHIWDFFFSPRIYHYNFHIMFILLVFHSIAIFSLLAYYYPRYSKFLLT